MKNNKTLILGLLLSLPAMAQACKMSPLSASTRILSAVLDIFKHADYQSQYPQHSLQAIHYDEKFDFWVAEVRLANGNCVGNVYKVQTSSDCQIQLMPVIGVASHKCREDALKATQEREERKAKLKERNSPKK
jgi:hypothetical protein